MKKSKRFVINTKNKNLIKIFLENQMLNFLKNNKNFKYIKYLQLNFELGKSQKNQHLQGFIILKKYFKPNIIYKIFKTKFIFKEKMKKTFKENQNYIRKENLKKEFIYDKK